MVFKTIKMYYNFHEKNLGNGFYPYPSFSELCDSEIDIVFEYINGVWKQYTEDCIKSLSKQSHANLLNLLNCSKYNSNVIVDRLGMII